MDIRETQVAVVGLGYVGLPLAVAFGHQLHQPVVGFDIDRNRITALALDKDTTGEVDEYSLNTSKISFTDDPKDLSNADVIIVAVPTPVTAANEPDLKPLIAASATVARHMKDGATVVFESTVYPGVTESVCAITILQFAPKTHRWRIGYSPERMNPGDKTHTLKTIVKVVAGDTLETREQLLKLYGLVCDDVFAAESIPVAEMAKALENTQRDINIALMNEIANLCRRLDISVWDVLDAAQTKWNFLPFVPGLVGGHCIGVDPFYLAHLAKQKGIHPEVILAGRRINDDMAERIATQIAKLAYRNPGKTQVSSVLILGMTFKEDVPDTRNSKVKDVIRHLLEFGLAVDIYDSKLGASAPAWGQRLTYASLRKAAPYDVVALLVPHRELAKSPDAVMRLVNDNGILFDLKGVFRTHREIAHSRRMSYHTL